MNEGIKKFGQAEIITSAKVNINFTKEAQSKYFLETGESLAGYAKKYISTDISKELRSALITLDWFSGFLANSLWRSILGVQAFGNHRPTILTEAEIVFDEEPTDEELEALIIELAAEMSVLKTQLTTQLIEWQSAEEKRKAEEAEIKAATKLENEAAEAREMEAAKTVNSVDDLHSKLMIVSQLEVDRRFSSWIKFVDTVDPGQSGAYMFTGDFLNEGTVEVLPERQIFLVSATSGSNKYQTTRYCLIEKTAKGNLIKQHVEDDNKRGWALRMRPHVETLLGINTQEMVTIPVELLQELIDALPDVVYLHSELAEQIKSYLK